MPRDDRSTERRSVRSDDPSLSAETNRELTDELRDIIGRDEVEVPVDRSAPAEDRHATHTGFVAELIADRVGYVVGILVAIVVLAILAVYTGSVLVLIGALLVLAVATSLVVFMTSRLAGQGEHPSPELAARMESEGVGDPDRMLGDLVSEFTADGQKAEGNTPPPDR